MSASPCHAPLGYYITNRGTIVVPLHSCGYYHQPSCVSVCVGRKRQFKKHHQLIFLPRGTEGSYTVSHQMTWAGVCSAATCLGKHTLSPIESWVILLTRRQRTASRRALAYRVERLFDGAFVMSLERCSRVSIRHVNCVRA